jgi:pyruvate/2-oxoglutarate/acetoin dehydrogenase E1 component
MTELYMGAQPAINFNALDAELRAALPGKLDGINNNAKTGELWVIVTKGQDAESLRPQIAAVIAAHDPAVLTAEQARAAAKDEAVAELKAIDFATLQKSGTLQEVRDAVFKMALAFGLTDAKRG